MTEQTTSAPSGGVEQVIEMRHEQGLDPVGTGLALALSGLAAVAADLSPTGVTWWDRPLTVLAAMAVTLGVALAPRWTWFISLAVVAGLAASPVVAAGAVVALLVAVLAEFAGANWRYQGAFAGVVVAYGVLHLRSPWFFGSATALGAAVALLVGSTALCRVSEVWRRRIAVASACGLAAVIVSSVLGVFAVAMVRNRATQGAEAARNGLEAARDGEVAVASDELTRSTLLLGEADGVLSSWWTKPARLVPVLGQHVRASQLIVSGGAEVVEAAGEVLVDADVDQLKASNGAVNLERVRVMGAPLGRLEDALSRTIADIESARSPWLIEPVRRRLDAAHAELGEALPDASKAAEVTRLLPGLLGGDRPRRYVVLFATPAESRELGGIVGNVVELTVDNGRVTITGHHRDDELNASGPGEFADRTDYPARFLLNHPELFAQNWAGMTDFPSVARAVAELYPTMGGRPVDGVLYTDPYGLAALMEFTGPIDVPELGRALDSESVAAFLLVEQYGAFALDDRLDFLEEIAVSTFARLLEVELPGPRRIGDVLGPAARQGRLRMATFDDEENALLDRLFLLGAQPSNDGSDYLAVVHANGGADKLDAFLTRRVRYNAVVDPATGGTTAKVTVSLSNEVEPDGLPSYVIGSPTRGIPPGTNRVHLSIVTPHQLEAVNVDGVRVDAEPQVEFGFSRYLVFVDVAPGSSSEVTFDLSGVVALNVGEYHLRVGQQAVANPDRIAIEVTLGDQRLTEQFLLLEDTRFTLSSTPR